MNRNQLLQEAALLTPPTVNGVQLRPLTRQSCDILVAAKSVLAGGVGTEMQALYDFIFAHAAPKEELLKLRRDPVAFADASAMFCFGFSEDDLTAAATYMQEAFQLSEATRAEPESQTSEGDELPN